MAISILDNILFAHSGIDNFHNIRQCRNATMEFYTKTQAKCVAFTQEKKQRKTVSRFFSEYHLEATTRNDEK